MSLISLASDVFDSSAKEVFKFVKFSTLFSCVDSASTVNNCIGSFQDSETGEEVVISITTVVSVSLCPISSTLLSPSASSEFSGSLANDSDVVVVGIVVVFAKLTSELSGLIAMKSVIFRPNELVVFSWRF